MGPLGNTILTLPIHDPDLIPTKRLPLGSPVVIPQYGGQQAQDGTGKITKINDNDTIQVLVGSGRVMNVPWWIVLPDPRQPAVKEDPAATAAFTP